MLAVSPLRSTTTAGKDERGGEMEGFPMGCHDDFPDFTGGNLLDSIDFDDLFVGIHDGDVLPDLEMDPEVLAEFSISAGEEYSDATTTSTNATATSVLSSENQACAEDKTSSLSSKQEAENNLGSSNSGSDLGSGLTSVNQGEEILSKRDENTNPSPKENYDSKGKKSSAQSKNNPQGKRKVKVDWTPELHRRFVQAVEQMSNWVWIRQSLQGFWSLWELIVSLVITLPVIFKNIDLTGNIYWRGKRRRRTGVRGGKCTAGRRQGVAPEGEGRER